jgi:DNA polymerase I
VTTLLIDGDLLIYKAASAVERAEKWDDENWVLSANIEEAKDVYLGFLKHLGEKFDNPQVRVAFTKGRNFRYDLSASYKSNRKEVRKPMCLAELRDHVEYTMPSLSLPNLEADDILGIWATNGQIKDPIIVSDDKDMKTIPGRLYRQGEIIEVSEEEADYHWMYQTLVGDAADGYTGLPGCGPKGAEKVLDLTLTPLADTTPLEAMWSAVVKAYEAKGLTEEDALLQARLSRILRASDWDTKKKEVKLWTPSAPSAAPTTSTAALT